MSPTALKIFPPSPHLLFHQLSPSRFMAAPFLYTKIPGVTFDFSCSLTPHTQCINSIVLGFPCHYGLSQTTSWPTSLPPGAGYHPLLPRLLQEPPHPGRDPCLPPFSSTPYFQPAAKVILLSHQPDLSVSPYSKSCNSFSVHQERKPKSLLASEDLPDLASCDSLLSPLTPSWITHFSPQWHLCNSCLCTGDSAVWSTRPADAQMAKSLTSFASLFLSETSLATLFTIITRHPQSSQAPSL